MGTINLRSAIVRSEDLEASFATERRQLITVMSTVKRRVAGHFGT